MQSIDTYLTRYHISLYSSELAIDTTIALDEDRHKDPLRQLFQTIGELDLPRNISLNLILDQAYIGYFNFHLPAVSRRKLGRILRFELGDYLIDDIDEFFYDYRFSGKRGVTTQVGIYLIRKDVVNRILQFSKSHNLEIRSILPLSNLIDLRLQEKYQPQNEIIAVADSFQSGIYVYQDGFLVTGTTRSNRKWEPMPVDRDNNDKGPYKLKDLNRRIRAVNLERDDITGLRIDESSLSLIRLDEENELSAVNNPGKNDEKVLYSTLLQPQLVRRSNRINLLKSNFFLIQEIRKHTAKIAVSGLLLILFFLVFVSSLFYENHLEKERLKDIEKAYTATIEKYLPKGTSKSNALQNLRSQVQQLKEEQALKQKFNRREYKVSSQLAALSKIRQTLPTLVLHRFYQTDQSIRIQGEIDSFTQYEKLKNNLQKIYSTKEFELKYNQKSSGESRVQFSIIIRSLN